jgi:hypothetical protein
MTDMTYAALVQRCENINAGMQAINKQPNLTDVDQAGRVRPAVTGI